MSCILQDMAGQQPRAQVNGQWTRSIADDLLTKNTRLQELEFGHQQVPNILAHQRAQEHMSNTALLARCPAGKAARKDSASGRG